MTTTNPKPFHVHLALDSFQTLSVTPWFSYTTSLPTLLPTQAEREPMKTERLVIRPITPDDLDAFWELRQIKETQTQSKERGCVDESKEETAAYIARLAEREYDHWYFGIFLASTGAMIGEAGIPSATIMATSFSGWPEAEFLLAPQYWRQGYGTEVFKAIVTSWWELPRQWRRLQLIPALVPDLDAGADVPEGLVLQWSADNVAAAAFCTKMLGQMPVSAEGFAECIDMRRGREGTLTKWAGLLSANPNPPPPKPECEED